MTLGWFAEPFQAYGSFAGEGTRRVLGKPELDPLEVLVRETGQNSWDAKRDGSPSVSFAMHGWTADAGQRLALRDEVFALRPPDGLPLANVLDRPHIDLLCISDRGTRGLAGPTRADRPTLGSSDFVNYVFNMGQPRDLEGGGGTYGFGKTITYVVSGAASVVVRTRIRTAQGHETRLIGIAVGSQYEAAERRFTGRHWWGITGGSVVQPVIGDQADQLSARLGLSPFGSNETGTDILIISPDFGGRSGASGMRYLADAALWHFWPKTIARAEAPAPMRFTFAWAGESVPFRTVDSYPPLHAFAQAFRGVKAFQGGDTPPDDVMIRPIESLRPRRRLGVLGIVRVPRRPRIATADPPAAEGEPDATAAAFRGNSHHVALMRQVNLVVTYRPGPELPVADLEWAGVFINEPDVDPAFAEAEPPTHDEWRPAMVADKIQKRIVNLALRSIDAELRDEFGTARPTVPQQSVRSPVVVADALGGLVAGSRGTGSGQQAITGSGAERTGGQGVRRPVLVDVSSRLILFRGERCTVTQFRVRDNGSPIHVRAEASVAIDGTRAEREPPIGSALPAVVGWGTTSDVEGGRIESGAEITIAPHDSRTWAVVVRNPTAAALSIELTGWSAP